MFVKPRWRACPSVRGDGGGLYEAVETAGKNTLQTPANVAVGLAFGAASCVVVRILIAAEPGDRNGVQARLRFRSPIRLSRCRVLAAAGFECRSRERGERCFVANVRHGTS